MQGATHSTAWQPTVCPLPPVRAISVAAWQLQTPQTEEGLRRTWTPPPDADFANRDRSIVRTRQNLTHYLHGLAGNSLEELARSMDEVGELLASAKRELEVTGRSDTTLDAHTVDCYLTCEDALIRCVRLALACEAGSDGTAIGRVRS